MVQENVLVVLRNGGDKMKTQEVISKLNERIIALKSKLVMEGQALHEARMRILELEEEKGET